MSKEPEAPAGETAQPAEAASPAAPRPPAADSLSVLASGFAHDLNNLLTGILGSVALIRAAQQIDQSTEPYLAQIETAALCAGELGRQVLAHAGRGAFVTERLHLSQLVAQILPLIHLALGGRAQLKLELVDDLPLVVADATQLRQVLLNLVTNGAEAILAAGRADGELTISTRSVELDTQTLLTAYAAPEAAPGLHVALHVHDNGVGIPPELRDRIFEPFFTTKPSESPLGRGLGLAIVLGVVRGHRGVLQVRSLVGQGTEFALLLPGIIAPAPPPPSLPLPSSASEHTILVIDDDPTVQTFVARVLRNAGYRVIPAGNGKAALAQLGAAGPRISLIILDWSLGPGDGESLARQLHHQRPVVPLVLMSGYAPAEYANRLHGVPIAGILQKPFRLESILSLVRKILR